jgi:hypothetical protein
MTTHLGLQRILLPSAQVSQLTTGSITLPSARTAFIPPTSFQPIASFTAGAGGSTAIDFTSIPATYTHLQIRYFNRNAAASDATLLNFNKDSTVANYVKHNVRGNGTSTQSVGQVNIFPDLPTTPYLGVTSSVYNGVVLDILDYANTNKYKTLRALGGYDANGSGQIWFVSALWKNTSAITSIKLYAESGNIAQYSSFALYGIKGA